MSLLRPIILHPSSKDQVDPADPQPSTGHMANLDIPQAADVPGGLLLYTGIEKSSELPAVGEGQEEVSDVLYMHPDMQKRVQDGRRQEAMRQAEVWRTLHQGRARASRPGWLYGQRCWLLCQLGRLLVRVGQQLEGYGLSQPA